MKMLLQFDRKYGSFDGPDLTIAPTATNARHLINEVIGNDHSSTGRGGFNDLGFYMDLCARDGCVKVEICGIEVLHSNYCMGIQVEYRSTFSNGDSSRIKAPEHFYHYGYYSYSGGNAKLSRLTVEDGEYLAGIRTREGDITDQITFVTNLRTLSFGGTGGDDHHASIPVDLSRRVIAFAGTALGVLERLGDISISRNWEVVGPVVLLRVLAERNRASVSQRLAKDDAVIQRLIVDTSDEIFQRTLSFLAPGIVDSD